MPIGILSEPREIVQACPSHKPSPARGTAAAPGDSRSYLLACILWRMAPYSARGRQPRDDDWNEGAVRALREHLRMSQRQFADEVNARQQTVSEWETGRYRPRGASARLLTLIAEQAGYYGPSGGGASGGGASGGGESGGGQSAGPPRGDAPADPPPPDGPAAGT